MMAKHEFELFLEDDPAKQESCLNTIQQQFGERPTRIYEDSATGFENFYEIIIENSQNIWDTARELAAIQGVIEVDPVTKIFGIFNEPRDHDDFPQNTQWNHGLTKFDQAIEFSKQQGKLNVNLVTAIRIVQLDTGYTHHPEISSASIQESRNFVEGENENDALDIVPGGILDQPSHGTSTASVIIGRRTDEPGDSNNGVFPFVNLIPYRISASVIHITKNTIPKGIIEAVDSGCEIITMSMGGAPPRRSWREAATYALSKGVIFISAAGNYVHFVVWPARYEQVIAVAGVNFDGLPWEGSCWGSTVAISAPGENVFIARTPQHGRFTYKFSSGTSYATPHVAAAAALWLNHFQDELKSTHFQENPAEKVRAFRFALLNSAFVPPTWTDFVRSNFGEGILDARALLDISPQDYLDSMQTSTFGMFSVLESVKVEKSPSLLEKEMIYLLLNNDAENQDELDQFIAQSGSETAKLTFENMRAANQSRMTAMTGAFGAFAMDEPKVNDLRSFYLESLAQNW